MVNRIIAEKVLGKRFGSLVVVEEIIFPGTDQRRLRCDCDCGQSILAFASNLLKGSTRKCTTCSGRWRARDTRITWRGRTGDLEEWAGLLGISYRALYNRMRAWEPIDALSHRIDPEVLDRVGPDTGPPQVEGGAPGKKSSPPRRWTVPGDRFGTLTVVSRVEGNAPVWDCVCDCGKPRRASQERLHKGQVHACHTCTRLNIRKQILITWGTHTMSVRKWAETLGINEATLRSRLCKVAEDDGPGIRQALSDGADPMVLAITPDATHPYYGKPERNDTQSTAELEHDS